MHQLKNIYISSCINKMSKTSKEAYKKCEVEIIEKGKILLD